MKKGVKNILRGIDMFGKPIMFKFGKEGEYFKTVLGGIISLFIYIAIIAFTCFRFYILFTR